MAQDSSRMMEGPFVKAWPVEGTNSFLDSMLWIFSHVFPIFGVACITAPVFLFKGVECCIVKTLESACAVTVT